MYNNNYFQEHPDKEFPDFEDITDTATLTIMNMTMAEFHCQYKHLICKYKDPNYVMARCMIVQLLTEVLYMEFKFIAKILRFTGNTSMQQKRGRDFKKYLQVRRFNESYVKLKGYLTELYSQDHHAYTESQSDTARRLQYIRS